MKNNVRKEGRFADALKFFNSADDWAKARMLDKEQEEKKRLFASVEDRLQGKTWADGLKFKR